MSVDLGQVVGRGIKSITVSGTDMTILYTDNTSTVLDISNQFDVIDAIVNNNGQAITSNAIYDAFFAQGVMELKQTITNSGGGKIKVYSDGLYVYVDCQGDFTKTSSNTNIEAHKNVIVGTISNSEYRPSDYITVPANTNIGQGTIRVSIGSSGAVYIINQSDVTTVGLRTQLMYPVASRMPQNNPSS